MHDPHMEPPVNPLPPTVTALFVVIAGIEAIFTLAEAGLIGGREGIGWRLAYVREYGFSGDIFDWMVANGVWPVQQVMRFVTYPFLNMGFTQGLFAVVLLLAMGKMVAEAMGQVAFVAIFFVSGIGGALVYGLLLNDPQWLVGAYPNVYGLIGGYSFVMWRRLGAEGSPQARAFSLIAILMGIQLLWGVFFTIGTTWVAELVGFFVGFALCFVLAPGEWSRLLQRIRRQ